MTNVIDINRRRKPRPSWEHKLERFLERLLKHREGRRKMSGLAPGSYWTGGIAALILS